MPSLTAARVRTKVRQIPLTNPATRYPAAQYSYGNRGKTVTKTQSAGGKSARRVLIVEDERSLSTLLVYMLSREGYEVASAADGNNGLAAVHRFRPQIIVLDLGLPGLSGDDVCRAIRSDANLAGTFVLVLTGLEDPEARRRVRDAGADCYMCKPFDPTRLLAIVDDVCGRASGCDPTPPVAA